MKHKLITKENYLLVVDDSEIKVGDIVAEKLLTGGYELFEIHTPNDIDKVRQKKVTHSNQPLENINFVDEAEGKILPKIKPLSLSEVEEAIYGYSIYQKALDFASTSKIYIDDEKTHDEVAESLISFHKELVKDKLFTVEKAIQILEEESFGQGAVSRDEYKARVISKLQSLFPKTEWECIIDEQGKLKLI
jgi:hypothetical protein